MERRFSLLDIVSWLAIAFVVGWQANSGYYQLSHLWQQKNQLKVIQTTTLPKLQALANCEHSRAETNEQIAEEAIEGARPLAGDVAPDCPHPGATTPKSPVVR